MMGSDQDVAGGIAMVSLAGAPASGRAAVAAGFKMR
jgi:hypothetical protein